MKMGKVLIGSCRAGGVEGGGCVYSSPRERRGFSTLSLMSSVGVVDLKFEVSSGRTIKLGFDIYIFIT